MDAPREGRAPRSDRVPARRDREGGAASRARTRSWPPTRQVLASAERIQRLCEESYAALYESDDAVLGWLGGVWKRVGELAAIDPQFAAYVDARDGIKSQLEDLAFFLRSYADGVDASPGAAAGGRGSAGAARAAEAEVRTDARGRHRQGRALARERELLTGAGERAEDLQKALGGRDGALSSTSPGSCREAARGRGARSRATLEALLAELAMARTRFEVRFNAGEPCPEDVERAGHRPGEFYRLAEPRRGAAAARADRLRRRAVARHAGAEDADRRRRGGQDADLRRGRRRHRRAGGGRRRRSGCGRSATASRCSASRTCRRLPRAGRRSSGSRSTCAGKRTVTSVERLERRWTRRGDRAHDWRRVDHRGGPRQRARAAGDRRVRCAEPAANEAKGERRKRKSGGPRSGPSSRMAKKYLIETFGCQMNVHDSERMAGLLDQAGYEPTDRRPRRRRHRHQHLQRPRARRGEALYAPRRAARAGRGDRPPAAGRRRRLRRAAGRRRAAQEDQRPRHRRRHRHAAAEDAAAAGREGRRVGVRRSRHQPAGTT